MRAMLKHGLKKGIERNLASPDESVDII